MIASGVERLATEVRHLQRSEVREAEEFFHAGQKGSSAMPHKRNPVLSENLTGLARIVRAAAVPALENVALWHERDISHSSVERVIGPDATLALDFALVRLAGMMDKLVVHPERMLANLESLGGVVHSGEVLLALTRAGHPAGGRLPHRAAQRDGDVGAAGHAGRPQLPRQPAGRRGRRRAHPAGAIDAAMDPAMHLRAVDHVFRRVFGRQRTSDSLAIGLTPHVGAAVLRRAAGARRISRAAGSATLVERPPRAGAGPSRIAAPRIGRPCPVTSSSGSSAASVSTERRALGQSCV